MICAVEEREAIDYILLLDTLETIQVIAQHLNLPMCRVLSERTFNSLLRAGEATVLAIAGHSMTIIQRICNSCLISPFPKHMSK